MQITNQSQLNYSTQTQEAPLELKQGEVYKAHIKEKLNDSEAVIAIRGKEVKATFEGGVPAGDRVTVQVTGKQEQSVVVREMVPEGQKGKPDVSSEAKAFKSVGVTSSDSLELQQAVKLLFDKGQPLSKETVNVLKSFFEKAQGTAESKGDTVKALINKGLEVTETHLRTIHEALHGKPLNEVLSNIAKELNPNFDRTKAQSSALQKIVKDSPIPSEINKVPEKAQTKTQQESIKIMESVRKMLESEPDLQTALQKVKEEISSNPKIDREIIKQIEKSASEAEKLQSVGKERLEQALKNGEAVQPKLELTKAVEHIREQLQTGADIKEVQKQISSINNLEPEAARNIEKAANQAIQLAGAGRERLIKILQQAEQSLKQEVLSNANLSDKQINTTQNPGSNQLELPSETIKQALKQFQMAANVEEALNLIREVISNNPSIDSNDITKIEKAIQHAQGLNDKGREIAARQHISMELKELQLTLAKAEPSKSGDKLTIDPLTQYDVNEQLQSLQIPSKDILVTKITQKLAEVTHEFRELKREISRNLDHVKRIIDTYKQNSYPQAKQMMETTISKLDNTILKSDIMLFTDMKTEKQLLQASSQLADAKKLLARGDFSQASKIVGQVKELIDKVQFKPSDQKVMHFVGKESMAMEGRTGMGSLENAARGIAVPEPSARQMFETVRSLGLNHDSELANSLVFKNGDQSQQEQHQNNLKAILMKLQHEEAGTRVAQQAEQALNNVTGQQLLSKSDTSGTLQSMLFNLPMLLGGKPEDIQVYINSKNEGQQVDWENCQIYFLLETKKLGDVGIMVATTDRNLSITIKNDKPGFNEKMEPIANLAKERLKDIGYNVGSIHFTRLTPTTANSESIDIQNLEQKPQRPIFTEKGMDFKI